MRTTTSKTLTATVALFATLVVGLPAGTADAKTVASGGSSSLGDSDQADIPTFYYVGLANKLNAMLDELPNTGVGRPSL